MYRVAKYVKKLIETYKPRQIIQFIKCIMSVYNDKGAIKK